MHSKVDAPTPEDSAANQAKISYGVYMYLLMVWWLAAQVVPDAFHKSAGTFVGLSAPSIVAATLSWYLIEEPVSRLKDRFPTTTAKSPALAKGRKSGSGVTSFLNLTHGNLPACPCSMNIN